MKYINYTMPLFKKAVKRNNPKLIHLVVKKVKGYDIFEFWFVTQKAVINYIEPVNRSAEIMRGFLLSLEYFEENIDDNSMEFVKYE